MELKTHVDIKLSRPLEIVGADVSSIRMREPLVQDQIASSELKGSMAQQEVAMIANLCELSPDDIKMLPLRDYSKLQDAFRGFME